MSTARIRTTHRCAACGATAPKWAGRCDGCGEWNTLHEEAAERARPALALVAVAPARPIAAVPLEGAAPVPTGVGELDRVLGGGLVAGSVTLVGGEPGIGKSTVLLQALGRMAAVGHRVLYVSAEESAHQVRRRAERLDALAPDLYLATDTDLRSVLAHLDDVEPTVAVVDSIQALHDPALGSAPGSVSQVRHCAHELVAHAKRHDRSILIVGHVTKEGALAGPRVLEHVVDTVLSFEGDRDLPLRTLRAAKHRFGSTGELGLLAMAEAGLEPVPDPSELFLADRRPGVAGSVVVAALEGRRPVLVELQALVAPTRAPQARRSVQGLDGGRLSMVLAVLAQRVGLPVGDLDTYAMAVGGARVMEPAADLALALAVASSSFDVALPDDLVACAEIGLGGELRHVAGIEARLAEAARLGFATAVVPASCPPVDAPVHLVRAATVAEALVATVGAGDDARRGNAAAR